MKFCKNFGLPPGLTPHLRAKKTGHHAILRALAFKWLRILWRCWQDRQDYNQEKYLQQLEKRNSPIAARARQIAIEMAA